MFVFIKVSLFQANPGRMGKAPYLSCIISIDNKVWANSVDPDQTPQMLLIQQFLESSTCR